MSSPSSTIPSIATNMPSSSSTIPSIATNCKESSLVNIPYLPDELLLNCLARVSRLYHPTLFLVSKRFRSLVASMELYKNRKLIGCTESCLYVCVLSELNPYWFILSRKPARIPNSNPKPTLVSVPSQDYFPTYEWEVIADGSNIYMIGGSNYNDNEDPSSKVIIMDCQSHSWCEAPSMQVARKIPCASLLDGKIYVAGGTKDYSFFNCLECFDTKTQKWEHVPSLDAEITPRDIYKTLAIKGKIYLLGEYTSLLIYTPNETRWSAVELEMYEVTWMMRKDPDSFCMIDNVMYCCRLDNEGYCCASSKRLEWYDCKRGLWVVLKGLEELPELRKNRYVRLVNYGGKLAVLWEEDVSDFWGAFGSNEKMIWCAEILLERREDQEIYGKLEWCEIVLKSISIGPFYLVLRHVS